MSEQSPQDTWTDYYSRIKARRLTEAGLLWSELERAGVSGDATVTLDFRHFSNVREDADALADQLSEHYDVEVVAAADEDYWLIVGTTRPQTVELSADQHLGWVEFMADVAQSHACVFSSWSLDSPSLGVTFKSELIDA